MSLMTPEVIAWVESTMGGTIIKSELQGRWRPHYFVDVLTANGKVLELLVRFPRDPELVKDSYFRSQFTIEHEARVLEGLQGTDVAVPRYFGFDRAHQAILMEKVDGSNSFDEKDDAKARRAVVRTYIEQLAELHSMDPERLPGEALRAPRSAEALAFQNCFGLIELDYRQAQAIMAPEPLLEFGLWWLHNHVPQRADIAVLQGDCGPGQFMHVAGRLTALIDWELCHAGDPMCDLGNMRMRNMLYPMGGQKEFLDYYEEVSETKLDEPALCFYTVMATLLSPLGMAASMQAPSAAIDSMLPRFGWDVVMRRGLCDALAEASGVTIDPPPLPDAESGRSSTMHDYLVEHLEMRCMPIAEDDFDRYLVRGAVAIAASLRLQDQFGKRLEADDLEDVGNVLGTAPSDKEEATRDLSSLVRDNSQERMLDLIWLFSRMEKRREFLWGPLMFAQGSSTLEIRNKLERYPGPG
jgi:aminoglycoside phosphotransferase (APT) family kinase protein